MASNLLQRTLSWLTEPAESDAKKTGRLKAIVFAAIVTPVAALSIYSYIHIDQQLEQFSFLRRQAVAYLASSTLRSKFDGLVEVTDVLANSPGFLSQVEAGKWQAALESRPISLGADEMIDHMVAVDKNGIEMAQIGEPGGAVGLDHKTEDWFVGVSKNWNTYVSDIYTSQTAVPHQEIAVAVPIKNSRNEVIGALSAHVRLDILTSWTRAVDPGSQAEILFADHSGHAVVQSLRTSGRMNVTDLSAFGPVSQALQYYRGVEVTYDPIRNEQAVVAYEPVLRYGWAVVVKQPVYAAFALRDSDSFYLLSVYVILFLLDCLLALFIISTLNDITATHRREKIVFESVGEGLVVIDRRGHVMDINPAAETMFGLSRRQAKGRDFAEIFAATDESGHIVPREQRPFWQALAGQKNSAKLFFIHKNDGSRFPGAVTATPLMVEDGVTGAVMVFRDVSKEDELDRAKKEFISIASHQLLTPVSAIKGFLSLLLDGDFGPITDKQKEYLGKLFHLSERMIDLVDDLLNVSRIDMGVIETVIEKVDMTAFVKGEVDAVRPIAINKRLVIEETYDPTAMALSISTKLLRSVIQNLLSNAIKYTPEGGRVSVNLKPAIDEEIGHCVLFSVKDTGYGIPESAKPKIFQKFYRADNVRMMGAEGTGLGLYVVKSVMSLLHGRTWFESEEGKGTTFYAAFTETPDGQHR